MTVAGAVPHVVGLWLPDPLGPERPAAKSTEAAKNRHILSALHFSSGVFELHSIVNLYRVEFWGKHTGETAWQLGKILCFSLLELLRLGGKA